MGSARQAEAPGGMAFRLGVWRCCSGCSAAALLQRRLIWQAVHRQPGTAHTPVSVLGLPDTVVDSVLNFPNALPWPLFCWHQVPVACGQAAAERRR